MANKIEGGIVDIDISKSLDGDKLNKFKELLKTCLDSNKEALQIFQNIFGEDIYYFPIKKHKCDKSEASEYYWFCLQHNRIFKRLLTYEGGCSLKTYQYMVLQHIFARWKGNNGSTNNELLYIDEVDDISADKSVYCYGNHLNDWSPGSTESAGNFKTLLGMIPANKQIYLKLLLFEETGLESKDIKAISIISKKNYKETKCRLNNLEQRIKERVEKHKKNTNRLLDSCFKIRLLENKIKMLKEPWVIDKEEEISILEKRLLKEKGQRDQFRQRIGRPTVTYNDIADILKVSTQTVFATIKKIRVELSKNLKGI